MSSGHKVSKSSLQKLGEKPLNSEINVTPLVDVCLVLLIIFMVVTPMLQKGVPVNLPVTNEPIKTPDTEKQLQISVKSDSSVYVGPLVIRKDELASVLDDIHSRTPDREVAVKGDRTVLYKEIISVMKACREAGFENIGLITQPAKQPGSEV
jgi:biopolymer transport protein ExbD